MENRLTCSSYNATICVARTEVRIVSPESRAEYFRKRRESIGQLNVAVSKEKLAALEECLNKQGKTKTQWVNEKIDEELLK